MVGKVIFPATDNRKLVELRKINSVEIESSWKRLTDKAVIRLPRNVKFFDRQKIREIFRRGNPVSISLGYNFDIKEEFNGYITRISAGIPIEITCEDEMWKIKQIPVNFSSRNISLANFLKQIVPGYEIDALEGLELGAVRYPLTNVGEVLKDLQSKKKLYSYMKEKVLVCGKYYADDSKEKPFYFHLEKNVVSDSLEFKNEEDNPVKVIVTSILKSGKKISVEVGETGGDTIKLNNVVGVESIDALTKIAQQDYDKRKRGGLKGTLTVFGKPSITHGVAINIASSLYPERNAQKPCESVKKIFNKQGYRQVINIATYG